MSQYAAFFQIRGVARRGEHFEFGQPLLDDQRDRLAAQVGQLDLVALLQAFQPRWIDAHSRRQAVAQHVLDGFAPRRAAGVQHHRRGFEKGAAAVASRLEADHAVVERDWAGAQLLSREVHQYLAGTPGFLFRLADEIGHLAPALRRVVRAVDAGGVHAALDQFPDELVVRGRLAGQRHHEAHRAVLRRVAQQPSGQLVQVGGALGKVVGGGLDLLRFGALAGQRLQRLDDGLQIREYMLLGASQRRQAEGGELRFNGPQVLAAQPDVGRHVPRGGFETAPVDMRLPCSEAGLLRLLDLRAYALQFGQQLQQLLVVERAVRERRGVHLCRR